MGLVGPSIAEAAPRTRFNRPGRSTTPKDEAHAIASMTGQLAGALYGRREIPNGWLRKLAWREQIEAIAQHLLSVGDRSALPRLPDMPSTCASACKKVEMLFAHVKRILILGRLHLRGCNVRAGQSFAPEPKAAPILQLVSEPDFFNGIGWDGRRRDVGFLAWLLRG